MIAAIAIVVLRRPSQVFRPAGWAESVAQSLPSIAEHGILAIFTPVNGYMIVVSKLVDYVAATVSLYLYPELSAYLAILLNVGTALLIFKAPTSIPNKFVFALLALLVPVDPEVFSVSLYAFWWSAIWLLLLICWTENPTNRQMILAGALGLLASLSSPFGVLFGPIFALRFLFNRSRFNLLLCLCIGIPALVQIMFILTADPVGTSTYVPGADDVASAFGIVMGYFAGFVPNSAGVEQLNISVYGGVLSAAFLFAAFKFRGRLGRHFFFLLAAYIMAVFSIALRVDPAITTPTGNGPRYFFIPFVILAGMLVWLLSSANRNLLPIGVSVLALLWLNPLPSMFLRTHDAISWRAEAASCLNGQQKELPAHWTGKLERHWVGQMPQGCGHLGSWIDRIAIARRSEPLFTQETFSGRPLATARLLSNDGWSAEGFFDKGVTAAMPPGAVSLGSHIGGDSFGGSVVLEIQPNDSGAALFVRTGPSPSPIQVQVREPDGSWSAPAFVRPQTDWWQQVVVRGSGKGPIEVRVSDPGSEWGQWGAVAFMPMKE